MSEDADAPQPWESDPDAWRSGEAAPPDELGALMAEWSKPHDQVPMFKAPVETDPQGRVYGPLIQARVEGDGTLRLTVRRYTTPEERDRLVLGVLVRLGSNTTWQRTRREQGTHAPWVEWWKREEWE